jgi:hypothetical protein
MSADASPRRVDGMNPQLLALDNARSQADSKSGASKNTSSRSCHTYDQMRDGEAGDGGSAAPVCLHCVPGSAGPQGAVHMIVCPGIRTRQNVGAFK